MLWVLIRSTSNEYPQHKFFCREIKKKYFVDNLLSGTLVVYHFVMLNKHKSFLFRLLSFLIAGTYKYDKCARKNVKRNIVLFSLLHFNLSVS